MRTSGETGNTINIGELLGNSRVGPLQIQVFILSMICLIMDGFDVQAMGYVAPAVVTEFGVPRSLLGPVFSAANFGVLIGSLVFSVVADKIGRRPVLIGATLFFSAMAIVTAFAQSVEQLLWMRFIAGIGMGCIIPNATALVGEFSPKQSRVTLMMCITVGFTAGAAIGGFVIAPWMMPLYGWRSVFIFGGVVPLVIAMLMIWGMPESLQFLSVSGRNRAELARWLRKLDPTIRVDASTRFVTNEEKQTGAPFVHLFRDGRTISTILLWVVNFMNLLVLYSLSNWLPIVVTGMGYETQTAVLVSTVLQVGGTIGTFGLAWLIARAGFIPMLATTFAIATVSIALIGQPGISLAMLTVIVFVAGWGVIGGQPGVNALSATHLYPTSLRTTGVGWGLGIGRIGAIVGPYFGGKLLEWQWGPQELFWAAAIPALVSTVTMVALLFTMKLPSAATATQRPAPVAH